MQISRGAVRNSMSRRGRAPIAPIVVDSDEEDAQPTKFCFSRIKAAASSITEPNVTASQRSSESGPRSGAAVPATTLSAAVLTPSPPNASAADASGDDILGFDVFAKSNGGATVLALSSSETPLDLVDSPTRSHKRLRKKEITKATSAPQRGAEDDDYSPADDTADGTDTEEPLVPKTSKKRNRIPIDPPEIDRQARLNFAPFPGNGSWLQRSPAPRSATTPSTSTNLSKKAKTTESRIFSPPTQHIEIVDDDEISILCDDSVSPALSRQTSLGSIASPPRRFGAPLRAPSPPASAAVREPADQIPTVAAPFPAFPRVSGPVSMSGELWSVKYTPTRREELAVHPKKLQDLSDLLIRMIQDSKQESTQPNEVDMRTKLVIIQGPPGAGKSAAMRVLSRHLSALSAAPQAFSILEWRNETVTRTSYGLGQSPAFGRSGDSWGFTDLSPSLLDSFFMWLTGRRATSLLEFDAPPLLPELLPSDRPAISAPVVLFVEDLPNIFTQQQKQRFQMELGRSLVTDPFRPIVFSISDDAGGQSPVRSLFGEDILSSPHVKVISFRPVTKKNTLHALRRIATAERLSDRFGDADLTAIAEIAEGDLRSAINSLQWLSSGTGDAADSPLRGTQGTKRKGKASAASKSSSPSKSLRLQSSVVRALMSRDNSLSLFHAVGKVLYNKRLDPTGEETAEGIDTLRAKFFVSTGGRSTSSKHWRPLLKSKPEIVMDRFVHSESDLFGLFLHENYLSFLTAPSADGLADCADYYSIADVLQASSSSLASSSLKMSHFQYNHDAGKSSSPTTLSREGAALVAMYGTSYANTSDTPRGNSNVARFRKSSLQQASFRLRENARLASALLRLRVQHEAARQSNPQEGSLPGLTSIREGTLVVFPFAIKITPQTASRADSFLRLLSWYSIDTRSLPNTRRDQHVDSTTREALEDLELDGAASEAARADSISEGFSREMYDDVAAEINRALKDANNNRKAAAESALGDDPIED